MAIEVMQLTINSTLQREEALDEVTEESTPAEPEKQPESNKCLDAEMVKADVLTACKVLIRQAMDSKRAR